MYQDYAYLIKNTNAITEKYINKFETFNLGDEDECTRVGFGSENISSKYIVLAEDTAMELGAPGKKSQSVSMWTKEIGITGDKLYISGNDLSKLNSKSVSFLLLILLEVDETAHVNDFNLSRIKNMTNKLPGLMTKSMSNKMWVRIHKDLMKIHFSPYTMGQCLFKAYKDSVKEITKMDIIMVLDDEDLIDKFDAIFEASKVILGENKKLKWIEDGVVTCDDLNCNVCDEKPACDSLKDIVVKRKKNS